MKGSDASLRCQVLAQASSDRKHDDAPFRQLLQPGRGNGRRRRRRQDPVERSMFAAPEGPVSCDEIHVGAPKLAEEPGLHVGPGSLRVRPLWCPRHPRSTPRDVRRAVR